MNEFVETLLDLKWQNPSDVKRAYDVVIIGGGGHGLSTAYYLATRHGITNVCVIEADYIGSGNSGRNTTIIRANYGIPESVSFYKHSQDLYKTLEAETGCWIMHSTKGIIWATHTETGLRQERARALINTALGAPTDVLTAREIKDLCPLIDINGGGRYPIAGGSLHHAGASARHDRVVWAYAQGALAKGAHVLQKTRVTGLKLDGGKVVGVETTAGSIGAGVVLSAVGGEVTKIADMAGLRLPIRTHPLQAFVTNAFAQSLNTIVASNELSCYVSQTARGQMLFGAEFERQPSYSRGSTFANFQSTATKISYLLPFLKNLRMLRQWTGICDISPDFSPIMGYTPVDGLLLSTGWGTWGFKAIPAGGEQLAELIATSRTPEMIQPFALSRFDSDYLMADAGSSGTSR